MESLPRTALPADMAARAGERSASAQAESLTIGTITDVTDLCALEMEWNDLLRSASANTLFLTWEWIATWWSVYGSSEALNVLVARHNGVLVGIAPLKRVTVSVLGLEFDRIEFIGSSSDVTPEYLDLIVAPGYEAPVTTAFAAQLSAEPRPHVLDLRPLRPNSVAMTHLSSTLTTRGNSRCVLDAVCPVLDLPQSTEEFLKGRSRNYRKKIGEYERRCQQQLSASVRMSASRDEVRRDMVTLRALHRKRWGAQSRAFLTDEYIQFHQDLAERAFDRGWIRLFAMETGSRTVAMLYCLVYDGRYYYYQGGWDTDYARNRIGLVLMHRAILQAITDGARIFDFLRGEESYKRRWATRRDENFRLTRWSSRRVMFLDKVLHLARAWMRHHFPSDQGAIPDAEN